MKRTLSALAVIGLLGATGCAKDQPESALSIPSVPEGSNPDPADMMDICPMHVVGTTVSMSIADNRMAIRFVTATGDVPGLRERVQHLAEMHNAMCTRGSGNRFDHEHGMNRARDRGLIAHRDMMDGGWPPMAQGRHVVRGNMMMVPATATVQDIDGGAQLIFTPREPSQWKELALHLKFFVERMQNGECPMTMMMQHGSGVAGCDLKGTEHGRCASMGSVTGGGTGGGDDHEGHH